MLEGRKVEDEFFRTNETYGGLGNSVEVEHTSIAKPPGRGHRYYVRSRMWVLGGDQDD